VLSGRANKASETVIEPASGGRAKPRNKAEGEKGSKKPAPKFLKRTNESSAPKKSGGRGKS
jgi:hypothetical protein